MTKYEFAEFLASHGGGPPIRKPDSNLYLLKDGAEYRAGDSGSLMVYPAPTDRLGNVQARQRYASHWLKQVEGDFQRLRAALLGDGSTFQWPEHLYGPGSGDGPADLKQLQATVVKAREELADLNRQMDELPEVKEQRRQQAKLERMRRAQEEADSQARAKVAAITI